MILSNRAKQAIEVMRNGGYWRYQLERTFHGREQFKMSLRDARGEKVQGFGSVTKQEMESAGLLTRRECARSSVWPQEWGLA